MRLSRLRVALDATPLLGTRSGVGTFTAHAFEALAARPELEVAAFAVSWRRRRGVRAFLPPDVTVVDRPIPARPVQLAWRFLPGPPIEWWSGPLDVVHGTNFVVPPSRRAARVVSVHDLTPLRFPELCQDATRRYPELIRRAIAGGAFVHTDSDFVAHEVIDHFGAPPERVRTVHLGSPRRPPPPSGPPSGPRAAPAGPGERAGLPGAAALSQAGATRFVLAVGTVEPRKDYPSLVRAFDQLAGSRPDVGLIIAGAAGWGSEALDAALAHARHAGRIVRLGWVPNGQRDALLAAAAVLAYPSRYEGFGLPPLEAMAAGVPVVATDAGALPEVAGDGALLVPTGDVAALADALGRVLDDPSTSQELVVRGRHRAAMFTWDACAEGLSRLYADARAAR